MIGTLSSFGPAIANHLWQSTVFAAAGWLLSLLLRKYSARLRYAVWLAASIKFLVPFSLLIGLGGLLPRPHAAVPGPQRAMYSTIDAVGQPFSDVGPSTAPAREGAKREEGLLPSLPFLLATVWLCGMSVVLLVSVARWRQVAAMLRRTSPVYDGREAMILHQLGGYGRIELRLSPAPMEPGVFGILRPKLIWPEQLSEQLEDGHIESIVAHELAHVRRLDNLTAALHMLVQAVFWFHPMVWWMQRHMIEERERACDEAVIESGGLADIYAESLLKACRFCVESPVMCVAGISGADLAKRVRAIMTLRVEQLGRLGRTTLAMLSIATIAMPVAFGLVRMIPVSGQLYHPSEPMPTFEVATVKLPGPHPGYTLTPYVLPYFNDRVASTIIRAYNVPRFDEDKFLLNGPSWIFSDRYDFMGKIEDSLVEKMRKMPPTQLHLTQCLLMQSLLADRFKLKVHFETKIMPIYELVVAKGGPKLTPAQASEPDLNAPIIPPHATQEQEKAWLPNGWMITTLGKSFFNHEMAAKTITIDEMVAFLPLQRYEHDTIDRVVVNRTGITGRYDMSMTWTQIPPNVPSAALEGADGPDFYAALEKQLGLKLVPSKGPVEVLVIDHIEKPSGN